MAARHHPMRAWPVLGAAIAVLLYACGGSGGGDSNSTSPVVTTPPVVTLANSLPVIVDQGPPALVSANEVSANALFASVTVCTPGSTTACRTIDHIQVDTGSTGLRLIASALSGVTPTPAIDPTTSSPLLECVQFADGYSFGSVGTLDVTIGPRTLASLPVQIIGDPAAGSAPSSCASGPEESTVTAFGANGILGVGNFLQDCGAACASRAVSGFYYVCPASGSGCTSTTVALARQVPNPVALLSADNNGVVIQLPSVPEPGVATLSGTLYFGVNTQPDNALGTARVYQLTSTGTFTAAANGNSYPGSFVDSGSNAYFFASTIPVCSDATFFYCPVTSSGTATTVSQTATITGTNGLSATITFNVANADSLFATSDTAYPSLAGPNGALLNGSAGAFDFGLPFFFGRTVFVAFEGSTLSGVNAPAIAF